MELWKSWLIRQLVTLKIPGSSPGNSVNSGLSSSGKTQEFGSCIPLVRIQPTQLLAIRKTKTIYCKTHVLINYEQENSEIVMSNLNCYFSGPLAQRSVSRGLIILWS